MGDSTLWNYRWFRQQEEVVSQEIQSFRAYFKKKAAEGKNKLQALA